MTSNGDASGLTVSFTNTVDLTGQDVTYCVTVELNLDGGTNPLLATLEYTLEVTSDESGGAFTEEMTVSNSLGFEINNQDPITQPVSVSRNSPEVSLSIPTGVIFFDQNFELTVSTTEEVYLTMQAIECLHPTDGYYSLTFSGCDSPSMSSMTCQVDDVDLANFIHGSSLELRLSMYWSINEESGNRRNVRAVRPFASGIKSFSGQNYKESCEEGSCSTGNMEYSLQAQIQRIYPDQDTSKTNIVMAPSAVAAVAVISTVSMMTLGWVL